MTRLKTARACEQCGDDFFPRSDCPGRFCSNRCHGESRKIPLLDMMQCRGCLEVKPASAFSRDTSRTTGLQRQCRTCNAAYHAKNLERIHTRANEYAAARREQKAIYDAAYRERPEQRAKRPKRKPADPEARKRRLAAWHAVYYQNNKQQFHAHARDRRARVLGAKTLGQVEWVEIRRRDRDTCWLCGKRVPEGQLSYDHAVALTKGGEHSTRNIRVAHKRCNLMKNAKDIIHQRYLL